MSAQAFRAIPDPWVTPETAARPQGGGKRATSLMERLAPRVRVTPACWIWTGHLNSAGYGYRGWLVHRVFYVAYIGPIPEGLQLDHLCRNRACVNPYHLEPVTAAENVRRGDAGKREAARTHCPLGHPYDEANTYWRPDRRRGRECRTCMKLRMEKFNQRRRESLWQVAA